LGIKGDLWQLFFFFSPMKAIGSPTPKAIFLGAGFDDFSSTKRFASSFVSSQGREPALNE